jgi:type I restriction enzyme S subunit
MANLFTDNFPDVHSNKELEDLKIQYPDYDGYYIASGSIPERKTFFNELYSRYEPYADSHFLREVKFNFHQRSWEMYLACVLLAHEMEISSDDKGPDIKVTGNGKNIWIECTAPTKGFSQDRVPDLISGTVQNVPEKEMSLRLVSSLSEKFNKYQEYLDKKIISPDDVFIIAINRGDFIHPDAMFPAILKCLFSVGYLTLPMRTGDRPFYSRQDKLQKKNGSNVSMDFFEDPQHAGISAIIYSKNVVLNHPEKIGDDCILVHNPLAKNPSSEDVFKFLKQYKVQGNNLIIF